MRKLLTTLFLLLIVLTTNAQNTVTGSVSTQDGKPAERVNVSLKGKNLNSLSGADGTYSITEIPDGNYTVVISYAGMPGIEKKISLTGHAVFTLNFSLSESATELAEVIVSSRNGINVHPVSVGKINIDPFDNPQSLAVVSQGLIRDQQAQRLSRLLKM